MIIDCFPFFNELDLLDIRLKLLDDIVDKVILIESTRTFTLTKKRLFYNENKNRYSKYKNKITHIIVDDSPALLNKFFVHKPKSIFWLLKNKKSIFLNAHDIDFYQKNQVSKGLENCGNTNGIPPRIALDLSNLLIELTKICSSPLIFQLTTCAPNNVTIMLSSPFVNSTASNPLYKISLHVIE